MTITDAPRIVTRHLGNPDSWMLRGYLAADGYQGLRKALMMTPEAVHEEVGLTRQDCSELVERVLEMMSVALEDGQQVKLSGFGVFQVRAKRARMGRNPKTGEPAAIEPRRVIGFRASQVMKARVDRALTE